MDPLEGIWRLVDSRAWDESAKAWSAPYGAHPMGQIAFARGRMLAVLCNGDDDADLTGKRNYSSYGGPYTFDGSTLETIADVASALSRIGSTQVRGVVMMGGHQMLLRPPQRLYGDTVQRRELVWERVWRPADAPAPGGGN